VGSTFDRYADAQITQVLKKCYVEVLMDIIAALRNYQAWASERGALPPWILKISAKKGCFLNFEWEKTNFTTFGPWKKILPTPMPARQAETTSCIQSRAVATKCTNHIRKCLLLLLTKLSVGQLTLSHKDLDTNVWS